MKKNKPIFEVEIVDKKNDAKIKKRSFIGLAVFAIISITAKSIIKDTYAYMEDLDIVIEGVSWVLVLAAGSILTAITYLKVNNGAIGFFDSFLVVRTKNSSTTFQYEDIKSYRIREEVVDGEAPNKYFLELDCQGNCFEYEIDIYFKSEVTPLEKRINDAMQKSSFIASA